MSGINIFPPNFKLSSSSLNLALAGKRNVFSPLSFGGKGDGVTDDSNAMQLAATAAGVQGPSGGTLDITQGYNFLISRTIFLNSYTTVSGGGLITCTNGAWNNPAFTPTADGFAPGQVAFCNLHWSTMTIIDTNIKIMGINFQLQPSTIAVRKGAYAIHQMQQFEFANNVTIGGGGVGACLGTDQTSVHDNQFLDFRTTASDHYAGFTRAWVCDNYYRKSTALFSDPCIQFTGTNANNTPNNSKGVTCTGNRILGGAPSVFAIGITEAGDATSTCSDVLIANNFIDLAGFTGSGGIGGYGGGDNWRIYNNTVIGVIDYNAIQVFSNGLGQPTRPQVCGNRVLDSTRITGGQSLLNVIADNAIVVDNDVIGCTALNPITVTGNACYVRNGRVDPGSAGSRGAVTGTNTLFIDPNITLGRYQVAQAIDSKAGFSINGGSIMSAYVKHGTWTPQLQFGGASAGMTFSSQLGTYEQVGALIFLTCNLVLTNKGTSTGRALILGAPGGSQFSGGTPGFFVHSALNMNSLTKDPLIGMSGLTITLGTSAESGGVNLDDTYFQNITNLNFSGWYQIT